MAFIESLTVIGFKEVIAAIENFFRFKDEWVVYNQHDFSKSKLKDDLKKEGYELYFAKEDKVEGYKEKGYEIIRRKDKTNKKIYMYHDGQGSILMGKKLDAHES